MTNQTDSKVPEIRLKGFSGEWEQKPIGKILSETKRPIVLEDNQQYELVTVKRRNGGVVSRGYLWGREILVKNYSQLQTGDFLISKRQVVHGATGIVPVELNKAIVSNEYLVAVGNNEITTEFLTILASLPDMRKKFFLSSYGVDIEKLFFDVEDWKKRSITIPEPLEQTQIVGYFQKLDSLIGLHQRKHDKLVTLKKGMLQKMFPQAGATTPEIRFRGFSGDWVGKSLGELSSLITKGTTPLGKSGRGLVNFIKIENINKLTGEIKITSKISEREHLNYLKRSQLKTGDILFSIAGTLGRVAVVHENLLPANTNQALAIIRLAGGDVDYITTYLKGRAVDDFVKKNPTVGAQPNLSLEQVENLEVLLPPEREQQKIGSYFRQLDELIFKHAIQLQKLQQIKSACLERMFV
jgi:type I restriction enzyme S subunit